MKTYTYRGHKIVPKRDFGTHGYLSNGKWIKKGWVVTKRDCNVMPGATWFQSIRRAKEGIDVLICVRGNGERFWEIMQPFKYKRGQRVEEASCVISQGRFTAVIEDHIVVSVTKRPRTA